MKKIFGKILEKALPHYRKARKGDVEHIQWHLATIPKFVKNTDLDPDIIIPLAILHDVGYSMVKNKEKAYDKEAKKLHCKYGAEIAKKILDGLGYDKKKTKKILHLILHHDDWIFGKSFKDQYLLFFTNFDFIWMVSKEGFKIICSVYGFDKHDLIEHIKEREKINISEGRNWYNNKIKSHYETLLRQREEELST